MAKWTFIFMVLLLGLIVVLQPMDVKEDAADQVDKTVVAWRTQWPKTTLKSQIIWISTTKLPTTSTKLLTTIKPTPRKAPKAINRGQS